MPIDTVKNHENYIFNYDYSTYALDDLCSLRRKWTMCMHDACQFSSSYHEIFFFLSFFNVCLYAMLMCKKSMVTFACTFNLQGETFLGGQWIPNLIWCINFIHFQLFYNSFIIFLTEACKTNGKSIYCACVRACVDLVVGLTDATLFVYWILISQIQ